MPGYCSLKVKEVFIRITKNANPSLRGRESQQGGERLLYVCVLVGWFWSCHLGREINIKDHEWRVVVYYNFSYYFEAFLLLKFLLSSLFYFLYVSVFLGSSERKWSFLTVVFFCYIFIVLLTMWCSFGLQFPAAGMLVCSIMSPLIEWPWGSTFHQIVLEVIVALPSFPLYWVNYEVIVIEPCTI